MTIPILLNHLPSKEQIADLGIELITPPLEIKEGWAQIPPGSEWPPEIIFWLNNKVLIWLIENSQVNGYVWVQGEMGVTVYLVSRLREVGRKPIYATTKRISNEQIVDGKTIKNSTFQHAGFREYI